MAGIEAIIPSRYTSADKGKESLDTLLKTYGEKMEKKLKEYPAAQPWKGPTPKSGPRAGGRRTGNLGRSWKSTVQSGQSVTVESNVPYASYVQGSPGQTGNMKARGWKTTKDIAEEAWKEATAAVKLEA